VGGLGTIKDDCQSYDWDRASARSVKTSLVSGSGLRTPTRREKWAQGGRGDLHAARGKAGV